MAQRRSRQPPRGLLALLALALLATSLLALPRGASAASGWQLVLDRPAPDFAGSDFVSPSEGWLVASAGVLHTTDGGASWAEAAKLTALDVDFTDARNGWLAGHGGAIFATTDGGSTWTAQDTGTDVHLRDVLALSPQEAWAVGQGEGFSDVVTLPVPSAFLRTTDGGATWREVQTPPDSWFREITFVGERGWALGARCAPPPDRDGASCPVEEILLHTIDGGATWQPLAFKSPVDLSGSLTFVSETEGWTIGTECGAGGCTNAVLHTTDGGATWGEVDAGLFSSIYDLTFRDASTGGGLAQRCNSGGCSVVLFSTVDGGATWNLRRVGDETGFDYRLVLTPDVLMVTGFRTLLRSVDRGESWEAPDHPALRLDSVDFAGRETGYLASAGAVLRTNDGGETWRRLASAPAKARRVAFPERLTGFVATFDCNQLTACVQEIHRTRDGGATWERVHTVSPSIAGFVWDFEFVDALHGWLALDFGFAFTADGGATWRERPLGELGPNLLGADIAAPDQAYAFIASNDRGSGAATLARTRDAGRTWDFLPGRTITGSGDVSFVDAGHGWHSSLQCDAEPCRYLLFATDDGGETWTERGELPGRNLLFVDPLNGWTDGGQVAHTADAGQTWTAQLGGELLEGTFDFVDVEHGWFALRPERGIGIGGGIPHRTLLYRTTDGGGGPIGEQPPELPDVGGAPAPDGAGLLAPAVLLVASGSALVCAAAATRRRRRA